MPVLERAELEASPLADLHAIADQVGVDGFRRLRKADLIDEILAVQGGGDGTATAASESSSEGEQDAKPARKRRLTARAAPANARRPMRSRPSRTARGGRGGALADRALRSRTPTSPPRIHPAGR